MVMWLGIPIGDMEYQCTILGYNQPQISCREEYDSEIGYLSCYFVGLPTSRRCAIGAFAQTAAMSGNPHQRKDKWMVDSECTNHLSPYPERSPEVSSSNAYESEELTVMYSAWKIGGGGFWLFQPPKPLSFTDYCFTIKLTIKRKYKTINICLF